MRSIIVNNVLFQNILVFRYMLFYSIFLFTHLTSTYFLYKSIHIIVILRIEKEILNSYKVCDLSIQK